MTDTPLDDREDAPPEPDELQDEQQEAGYGADEGEREEALPDE